MGDPNAVASTACLQLQLPFPRSQALYCLALLISIDMSWPLRKATSSGPLHQLLRKILCCNCSAVSITDCTGSDIRNAGI